MRNKALGTAALAAALTISTSALAADCGVYYLSELGMSQSAFIKTFGNKAGAKEAQALIASRPDDAAELRAQGVVIKNVILAKTAFDGSIIYYVK
jgi:hypothetical protein